MTPLATYRGQPLVAMLAILGGWVTMRAIAWNIALLMPQQLAGGAPPPAWSEQAPSGMTARATAATGETDRIVEPLPTVTHGMADRESVSLPPHVRILPHEAARLPAPELARQLGSRPMIMAHNLMWMAAVAQMPLPAGLSLASPVSGPPAPFFPAGREPAAPTRRWSADGWLLLRGGGSGLGPGGAVPATYGGSQLGAVLRYKLAPDSGHRPAAYLRVSSALNGRNDRELALGLSARPIARIPVVAAVELRARNRRGGGVELRPAVAAISELAPISLPMAVEVEAYGQAGYVSGHGSTAFVDGQLRAQRNVARFGHGDLRAGAGVWGGAQKRARRLDVGPTATLGMPLGGTGGARLGLDWRFRVLGNAAPSSGPALSISAGF